MNTGVALFPIHYSNNPNEITVTLVATYCYLNYVTDQRWTCPRGEKKKECQINKRQTEREVQRQLQRRQLQRKIAEYRAAAPQRTAGNPAGSCTDARVDGERFLVLVPVVDRPARRRPREGDLRGERI